REIISQIQILGGEPPVLADGSGYTGAFASPAGTGNFQEEKGILIFCKMKEKKMTGAYREILNDPNLYEGLRSMMRYQLNGILCAFAQLKLLYVSFYER